MKKVIQIPDIHVPECSLFDGLYLDVQRTWVGSKFCVKNVIFGVKVINQTLSLSFSLYTNIRDIMLMSSVIISHLQASVVNNNARRSTKAGRTLSRVAA